MEKHNRLNIFWHICAIGRWKDIVLNQLETIKSSGLYEEAECIHVTFLGEQSLDLDFLKDPKIQIRNRHKDIKLYESACLNDLGNWSRSNDSKVLYLHSKGASRDGWEYGNVWEWRKMMEYFLVEKWEDCVSSLDEYDTIGCNISTSGFGRHYSGNFWWANSSYLSNLEPIVISNEDLWFWRCETWIMSGNPHYLETYRDKRTQHYYSTAPKNYKKKEICVYENFVDKWSELLRPWRRSDEHVKNMLVEYLGICRELMYQEEDVVCEVKEILMKNIKAWSAEKSKIYEKKPSMVSKWDLVDKKSWYVPDVSGESYSTKTSGSTTGSPFEYLRWETAFHEIEWNNHYNMVLDEFNISSNPHILYFFSSHYKTHGNDPIHCPGGSSELAMNNHGSMRSPVVHYVNFDSYRRNPGDFFIYLFDYLKKNSIDVFFASSPEVNSLSSHLRKLGLKQRISFLLSTTSERLLPEDAAFLLDGGYFDHICDHMRCWDGGATFFTCKYRNYHLMDNLAWCEEGPNRELICTDYFNLASPFVRYWNGDYCRIAKEYQRCECGRLYRDFEFLESRPFSLKGTNMREIQEKIRALGISGIKQVRCSVHDLSVVSTRDLTDGEKDMIRSVSDKFQFRFVCELF